MVICLPATYMTVILISLLCELSESDNVPRRLPKKTLETVKSNRKIVSKFSRNANQWPTSKRKSLQTAGDEEISDESGGPACDTGVVGWVRDEEKCNKAWFCNDTDETEELEARYCPRGRIFPAGVHQSFSCVNGDPVTCLPFASIQRRRPATNRNQRPAQAPPKGQFNENNKNVNDNFNNNVPRPPQQQNQDSYQENPGSLQLGPPQQNQGPVQQGSPLQNQGPVQQAPPQQSQGPPQQLWPGPTQQQQQQPVTAQPVPSPPAVESN